MNHENAIYAYLKQYGQLSPEERIQHRLHASAQLLALIGNPELHASNGDVAPIVETDQIEKLLKGGFSP